MTHAPVSAPAAPRRRALLAGAALLALAACGEPRQSAIDPAPTPQAQRAAATATAPSSADGRPDGRGVVVYRDYAAVVARDGDTVESMAARAGLPASELAAYNGLPVSYRPQRGDELVLPPRAGGYGAQVAAAPAAPAPISAAPLSQPVSQPLSQPIETEVVTPPATPGGSDGGWSAARINEAIDRGASPSGAAPSAALVVGGAAGGASEVIYHDVGPDETVYSVARRYGVAPETLIAWNALAGPSYTVRPGQVLTVPAGGAQAPAMPLTPPGGDGVAVPPPSASAPLPPDVARPTPLASPRLDQFQSPAPVVATPAPAVAAAPPAPASVAAATARAAAAPSTARAPDKLLRPVPGPVLRPWSRESGPNRNDGVDFSARAGEPVTAAADGTVALISTSLGEWGTIVLVRHDEKLMTVYGRMGEVAVQRGETVRAGQRLGDVAAAESGPAFLHFEVRRGAASEDPMTFF